MKHLVEESKERGNKKMARKSGVQQLDDKFKTEYRQEQAAAKMEEVKTIKRNTRTSFAREEVSQIKDPKRRKAMLT